MGRLRDFFRSRADKSPTDLVGQRALHTVATRAPREMSFQVELERETDGRWIAEVPELPGVMAYGTSAEDAVKKAAVLTFRVLADRLEHEEASSAEALHFSLVPRECVASR
jgi:predicted RNase H-like HicB family nuclease